MKIDFHHRRHNNSRNPRLIAGKTPNQRLLSLRVDPMNEYIINVDNFSDFSAESSDSLESEVLPTSRPISRDHESRMLRNPTEEPSVVDSHSVETTELLQNAPDKFSGTTQVEAVSSTKCWKSVMYQASLKAAMLSTGHRSGDADAAFSADLTKVVEGPSKAASAAIQDYRSPLAYQPEWGTVSEESDEHQTEKENYVIPDQELHGDITYSGILSCYDKPAAESWLKPSSGFPNKYGEGAPFFMNDAW